MKSNPSRAYLVSETFILNLAFWSAQELGDPSKKRKKSAREVSQLDREYTGPSNIKKLLGEAKGNSFDVGGCEMFPFRRLFWIILGV